MERIKASMESTGKNRPSSEGSSEMPDFDNGEGSSSKLSCISKRKRGQCRSKKQHENSPDLAVPLTINKEVSGDANEPPKKRIREEETTDDGMIFPLTVSFLSWRFSCFDPILSFF